jgi:hypothetical protein
MEECSIVIRVPLLEASHLPVGKQTEKGTKNSTIWVEKPLSVLVGERGD